MAAPFNPRHPLQRHTAPSSSSHLTLPSAHSSLRPSQPSRATQPARPALLSPPERFQDVNSPACASLNLSHVVVHVEQPDWLEPTGLDGFHVCTRCSITCQLSWNPSQLPVNPHARLFVHSPDAMPLTRALTAPLRVLLQMEADGALAGAQGEGRVDVGVGYGAGSAVQVTYVDVERTLRAGRQHLLADRKRQDVLVHHASSNCEVPWRTLLLESLLPRLPHHSFGACSNNMGGTNREAALYPACSHAYLGDQLQEVAHCVKSHYKFDLAIENTRAPNYVTEKFYSALEAGTVPVYFGAPDIASFAPPESFIDGRQFASHQALVDHINRLHSDPVSYMQYHAWRLCGLWGNYSHARLLGFSSLPCRLCEYISSVKT
ncbi:unnamed protein product [Closterium sp. NIES-53]